MLEVPDTVIAHERCPELVRILEKICCERCGIPMEAAAHYCQPKENPRKAEEEIALARKSGDDCRESGCSSGCGGLWHEPGSSSPA